MDFGNRRVHNRLGPAPGASSSSSSSSSGKVCHHWRAGRCNRFPCPFLHSELPEAAANSSRPNQRDGPGAGGHVWRNPNSGGGRGGSGPNRWGRGPGGADVAPRNRVQDRPCKYFLAGDHCSYGERCRYPHTYCMSNSITLLTPLQGHEQVVTGIALPNGSDKLYSGSRDGTVRLWDCQTGQCAGVLKVGGEVGCMISEGPWVFVGMPDAVKVWNMQTQAEMNLTGPTGQVYALAVGNELLFAATQDGRILAWRFSAATNCFEPAAALEGHQLAVVSLIVGGMRLYSGSMDKTIRVWDLATLQCIQTLSDHTSVVMSLLCWDQFLLSCSLDKTIKVWAATESGKLEVTYTHTEDNGALALAGMPDAQSKPVLVCSLNDNTARLYDLPSFSDRGKIFGKQEIRAIQTGPGGLFFTGDGTGELKVWQWVIDASQT
ncbi:zinc finger CCCH domain-containing protein 17-like [Lolium rigidum]|uniref:zinc finger CCCH domain-containing protein 17-like n=1 Tax=Lolium rigidum TaxID=89674 RepID=UPI001F5C580B|nr:zinc finger CCCH domain-containing protein 17-like [Lolium rigidum]